MKKLSLLLMAILMCAVLVGVSGCAGAQARTRDLEQEKPVVAKTASLEELLLILKRRMGNVGTLTARAAVDISMQNVLIPASFPDRLRQSEGKEFNEKFLVLESNGRLWLTENPAMTTKVRFSGEVIDVGKSFVMIGDGNQFWVMLPNYEEQVKGEPKPPETVVFTGTEERSLIRSSKAFSLRPQDVSDMLNYDEIFLLDSNNFIAYMETWPDFYVVNFLHPKWPQHIFSKVWFERRTLTPAIHQLFNIDGEMYAEARFGSYTKLKDTKLEIEVSVPTEADFLWPMDRILMKVSFSNYALNPPILSTVFTPSFGNSKVVEIPPGHRPGEEPVTGTDNPAKAMPRAR